MSSTLSVVVPEDANGRMSSSSEPPAYTSPTKLHPHDQGDENVPQQPHSAQHTPQQQQRTSVRRSSLPDVIISIPSGIVPQPPVFATSGSKPSTTVRIVQQELQACMKSGSLNLSGHHLGPSGAKALEDVFADDSTSMAIIELDLSRNELGSAGMHAVSMAFNRGLAHFTYLTKLKLSENRFGPSGAKALVQCFSILANLQHLNLDRNELRAEGARYLAEGLPMCMQLQTLSINENMLGPQGMILLAEGLDKDFPQLLHLHLNKNKLGDDGARALSNAMIDQKRLVSISIEQNDIHAVGLSCIAAVLHRCPNISQLHFDENPFGDDGIVILGTQMRRCPSLTWVSLADANIGDEGASAIAGVLPYCGSLQKLDLEANDISKDVVEVLKRNRGPSLRMLRFDQPTNEEEIRRLPRDERPNDQRKGGVHVPESPSTNQSRSIFCW